ncbi:hypothetical protein [Oceanibacterium hippocampi]|uniref:Uncharacterized protein n=1 Tax=Oceanibacterium hippocampi TaxID=745714 RepID=A0A1Y5TZG4_9PROT|nr:hypothetical protein [Oceanibacterium hippocampi]SLN72489.1 hypothetical protein OCH7691_03483 [Oceanibacterium hippocampi]
MFGFSFLKLLVLAAVVAGVWYGFKYLSRDTAKVGRKAEEAPAKAPKGRRAPADPSVEEMQKCARCGTYVTGDARDCGRAGCPYPPA